MKAGRKSSSGSSVTGLCSTVLGMSWNLGRADGSWWWMAFGAAMRTAPGRRTRITCGDCCGSSRSSRIGGSGMAPGMFSLGGAGPYWAVARARNGSGSGRETKGRRARSASRKVYRQHPVRIGKLVVDGSVLIDVPTEIAQVQRNAEVDQYDPEPDDDHDERGADKLAPEYVTDRDGGFRLAAVSILTLGLQCLPIVGGQLQMVGAGGPLQQPAQLVEPALGQQPAGRFRAPVPAGDEQQPGQRDRELHGAPVARHAKATGSMLRMPMIVRYRPLTSSTTSTKLTTATDIEANPITTRRAMYSSSDVTNPSAKPQSKAHQCVPPAELIGNPAAADAPEGRPGQKAHLHDAHQMGPIADQPKLGNDRLAVDRIVILVPAAAGYF
uniref:Uncharacterized protein n=1 Tax=Anopheles coluzzii TaxID=1518534 RepID=A0A8W7PU68_ANOCL